MEIVKVQSAISMQLYNSWGRMAVRKTSIIFYVAELCASKRSFDLAFEVEVYQVLPPFHEANYPGFSFYCDFRNTFGDIRYSDLAKITYCCVCLVFSFICG